MESRIFKENLDLFENYLKLSEIIGEKLTFKTLETYLGTSDCKKGIIEFQINTKYTALPQSLQKEFINYNKFWNENELILQKVIFKNDIPTKIIYVWKDRSKTLKHQGIIYSYGYLELEDTKQLYEKLYELISILKNKINKRRGQC
jgi:hypothetical protein